MADPRSANISCCVWRVSSVSALHCFPYPNLECFPTPNSLSLFYSRNVNTTPPSALRYQQAAADFILTELDLAIAFCQLALSTSDPLRADRNADKAKRALQAAGRAQERFPIGPHDKQTIAEKTSRIESLFIYARLER